MIIYSVIPPEVIFGEPDDIGNTKSLKMNYLGESVEVLPTMQGGFVISRLLSTSPKAYLNPNLQPGMEIKLN